MSSLLSSYLLSCLSITNSQNILYSLYSIPISHISISPTICNYLIGLYTYNIPSFSHPIYLCRIHFYSISSYFSFYQSILLTIFLFMIIGIHLNLWYLFLVDRNVCWNLEVWMKNWYWFSIFMDYSFYQVAIFMKVNEVICGVFWGNRVQLRNMRW